MKSGKIANLLIIIFAALLSLEAVLQIAGFLLLTEARKRNSASGGNFDILCVGDSFTYGLGATREESYPKQLEYILNKSYPQMHIKTINLGIPGYNSSQCLKALKDKFDIYKPKLILVMSGMNNTWNFIDSSYFKIKQFKYNNQLNYTAKYIDALLSNSKTYKLIKFVSLNLMVKSKENQFQYKDRTAQIKGFSAPQRSTELTQLLNQGMHYFEDGKYELSESCYRNALKLSPYDFEPHWLMGRFYNFEGQREKAKAEFIFALKFATHPYFVVSILADMQDQSKSTNSDDFKEYAVLIKSLRNIWVEKFGEECVHRLIDSMISYEDNDLVKIIAYDMEQMVTYARQNNAELVILTYPVSATTFRCRRDIYYRIADELGCPLVNNTLFFNTLLRFYKKEELFVADGHCTGKGYRFMAENILETIKKYNLLN